MFRIGEFSKLTQLSIRMLRYYDEAGLLKPEVVDSCSGYRGYSAKQIPDLERILMLRECKFTVEEMKVLLRSGWDVDLIKQEMRKKKEQIKEEIEKEKRRLARIEEMLAGKETDPLDYYVGIKSVPAMYIVGCKEVLPSYFEEGLLWAKLTGYMREEKIAEKKGLYNNVSLYHDLDYREHDVTVEVGCVVDKPGVAKNGFYYRRVELVENMAYAMVYGPYTRLAGGYAKLAAYLEESNEVMSALPSRQISHIGPCDTEDPNHYLTEIQIPLDSHTV